MPHPGLLHPKPLPPQQSTSDLYPLRRHSNTVLSQSLWGLWVLVSSSSPVFHNCDLLIAADCTAYAYGNFHRDFVAGRTTVIGCPKQHEHDLSEKLTQILKENACVFICVNDNLLDITLLL